MKPSVQAARYMSLVVVVVGMLIQFTTTIRITEYSYY